MVVLPPRPSPSRALCGAGRRRERPGSLSRDSVWPPPPGAEPDQRRGRGWRRRRRLSARLLAPQRLPQAGSRALEAVRPAWGPSLRAARPAPRPAGRAGGGRGPRAGRRVQRMGGRGADNAPGPARRRRASLAGVPGGRGAGTWRAGSGGGARRADKECASCARPRAGGGRRAARGSRKPDRGTRSASPGATPSPPRRGVRDACPLGGTWGALAPDGDLGSEPRAAAGPPCPRLNPGPSPGSLARVSRSGTDGQHPRLLV